jgi:carbonyl reductase 1
VDQHPVQGRPGRGDPRAGAGGRAAEAEDGTLVAAICPGLIETDASRPWVRDMRTAQTPAEAAKAPLRLALERAAEPRLYGELIQFRAVIPWR